MMNIYWPYVIGNDSPIPNLFEQIAPYIPADQFTITIFRVTQDEVISKSNVTEQFLHRSKPRVKQIKYLYNSLRKYNLIHTGGRVNRHYKIARLVRVRNSSISHVHTFRVDVNPDSKFNTGKRRKLADMADAVTAVSEHTARTVSKEFGYEPIIIYNGVDTQKFHPKYKEPKLLYDLSEGKPVFVYVGSFSERKRPKDVVKVAKAVKDCTIIMIGDGKLYSEVEILADSVDNLYLTGHLDKQRLPAIYANASGLIFPTVREGCPNVVLEAMASGTPVVGYEATSMPELVTHGENGYLRSVGDIDGLADAVHLVIDDETNELGRRAREYVEENHTFEKIAKEYVSIYQTF